MKIDYFGQSCFLFTLADGRKILTDPFGNIGYSMPKVTADIVTVSHDHYDHNNVKDVGGRYTLVRTPGRHDFPGIQVNAIPSYHDDVGGKKSGGNLIFCFRMDSLNICHLGDLGHLLNERQRLQIGSPDILLVPVGEVFTFSVQKALETIHEMKPAIVIPMHYKTSHTSIGLEKVDKFLKAAGSYRSESASLDLTRENIEDFKGIVVMETDR